MVARGSGGANRSGTLASRDFPVWFSLYFSRIIDCFTLSDPRTSERVGLGLPPRTRRGGRPRDCAAALDCGTMRRVGRMPDSSGPGRCGHASELLPASNSQPGSNFLPASNSPRATYSQRRPGSLRAAYSPYSPFVLVDSGVCRGRDGSRRLPDHRRQRQQ